MTTNEHKQLREIASNRFTASIRLSEWLESAEIAEAPKGTRTSAQNKAIHLDCKLIAEKLEAAGIDWKMLIREGGVDVPITGEAVKELLWRPIMQLLYGHTSTRDLKKTGEIEKIHETILRTLGQKHGIEWHDFPNDEARQREELGGYKTAAGETPDGVEYPEYTGAPTF